MPSNNAKESLRQFISRDPNAHYSFDSERDATQSEICRQSKNKECIILQMTSRELFAAMQVRVSHLSLLFTAPTENGFFCTLPMDPTRTYIECKRIPKP
ncbi:hypothetical protein BGY98DRAFT_139226 [Russula aff. rugulosa BPL654]|nr:hypothetical protein BGY98DRAFT_139226 [Russula aff. rugulosa BPL654]